MKPATVLDASTTTLHSAPHSHRKSRRRSGMGFYLPEFKMRARDARLPPIRAVSLRRIEFALKAKQAALDGEIACLDQDGLW